jgi:hypothetical protein
MKFVNESRGENLWRLTDILNDCQSERELEKRDRLGGKQRQTERERVRDRQAVCVCVCA